MEQDGLWLHPDLAKILYREGLRRPTTPHAVSQRAASRVPLRSTEFSEYRLDRRGHSCGDRRRKADAVIGVDDVDAEHHQPVGYLFHRFAQSVCLWQTDRMRARDEGRQRRAATTASAFLGVGQQPRSRAGAR